MSTLQDIISKVSLNLQGFTRDQDQMTFLTQALSADNTTMRVDDPKRVNMGTAEVGSELVYVKSVNKQSGKVTLFPFGRGQYGTEATQKPADTPVIDNPGFPKQSIKTAVNFTIQAVFPDLYRVKTTSFPAVAARLTYELPPEVETIRDVTHETVGPSRSWPRVKRWRFEPSAPEEEYESGKAIEVMEPIIPGRFIHVTYLSPPQTLTDESENFQNTGLPLTAEDVIVYGACYRMVGNLENSRLQVRSVTQSERSSNVQEGAAVEASKYFYALYQERLDRERRALVQRHPIKTHKVW